MMGSNMMSGVMLLMWLVTVVILVVIVAGIVLWVRWLSHGTGEKRKNTPSSDPEAILQERLARGEIDANEYRERLNALHNPK